MCEAGQRGLLHLIVISGAVYLEYDNKEMVVGSRTEKLASLSSHKSLRGTSPAADSPSSSSARSSEDANSQSSSTFSDAPPGERDVHIGSPSEILSQGLKDGSQPHAPWPVKPDDNRTSKLLDFYNLPRSPHPHRSQSDPGQLRVNASATPFLDETISPPARPTSLPIFREYLKVVCDFARSLIVRL